MNYPLSYFKNAFDTAPIRRDPTWEDLAAGLTKHRPTVETDKRRLAAWCPATFDGGRRAQNVVELSLLVLDYDDGTSIEDALSVWRAWRGCGYSSISHKAEAHRFRVVLPLAKPIDGAAWRELWRWANKRAAGRIDGKCCNADRVYFLPFSRQDAPTWAADWEGPALDLEAEYRKDPPPKRRRRPVYKPRLTGDTEARAKTRLHSDPAARELLAGHLDGAVSGGVARRLPCPKCGRRDVWFAIEPDRKKGAECNHRNSCGWFGPVWDLIV